MTEELENQLKTSKGRKIFADYLSENFENSDEMLEKFDKLTEMYLEVLAVTNISAIKEIDDIYIKHYLDSIYPYKYFSGCCCDVGCGGGFPCIPLSAVTDCKFLGIDGVAKKLVLIDKCAAALGLNIKSLHARAEELKRTERRFDTVCARAVGDMDKVLSYCAPLCKKSGKIVLYKTQTEERATKSTEQKLNISLVEIKDYTLPGTDIDRRLFVYEKI